LPVVPKNGVGERCRATVVEETISREVDDNDLRENAKATFGQPRAL
jgi:hypothetical protein